MKKTTLVTLIALSTLSTFAKTDYQGCMDYLNPNRQAGFGMGGVKLFGLPFELKADGSLETREGVDLKVEENGRVERFSYSVPGFEGMDGRKVDPMAYETIVKRDEKGNIEEIFHGPKMTNADLEKMSEDQKKLYLKNTPKEMIEQNNKILGGESQKYFPPFTSFKGSKVEFEIRNGKCMPMAHKHEMLAEPKVDGKTASVTNLDTKLCRDINEFLEANPEASACFKKDLNMKMGEIFKKHTERYVKEGQDLMEAFPRGMGLGMGMGYGMGYGMGMGGYGGFGSGFFGMPLMSVGNDVFQSNGEFAKYLDDNQYLQNSRRFSSSPILTGHKIVQSCFDSGLAATIDDDSLWEKKESDAISGQSSQVEAK